MQRIQFHDNTQKDLQTIVFGQDTVNGYARSTVGLTIADITYQQAVDLLNDKAWSLIGDDGVVYDYSDYTVLGSVTDNRDGTMTVLMGQNNTAEQDLQDEVNKASQELVTLAGKPLSVGDDIQALRATFEAAAAKLSDDDAKIAPSLSAVWNIGQNVAEGERRYYAPNDTLYKCLVSHTTALDNAPDVSTTNWAAL